MSPMLALLGVNSGLRPIAGPMLPGTLASKMSEVKSGTVPLRLTFSMRPAICALVVSLNLNSLKM
jgi:hypothetical protein